MSPTVEDREGFDVVTPFITREAVRPVDGTIPNAGNFGGRHVDNCRACSVDHRGTDFSAAAGTPIHVVLDGVVEQAGPFSGYGNTVLVRHSSGLATRYAHMSAIEVRVGQSVPAGTEIGLVGSTGVSTGPHLHFEVIVDGRQVDPGHWLAARGVS
jgi:murein DD-endopeptidase MepM/ murein hydrolase activator NlpD